MPLSLGDRMKQYESLSNQKLLTLVPVIGRFDGRAFHSFTTGLVRPYDQRLSNLMTETTRYLVAETGAKVGYTQSDEISLVWYTDDQKETPLFDNRVPKLCSVVAAMATAFFNSKLAEILPEKAGMLPLFDGRVYNVPTLYEACNYLLWRERDATRNSITMAAQSVYSHNELHQKDSSAKQEMLFQKGINWNDYPSFFKRGTYVARRKTLRQFTTTELEKLPPKHAARVNPNLQVERHDVVVLDLPPLGQIANQQAVIFCGAAPELKSPFWKAEESNE